jgi:transglutaminase-like putative cysteine protease
MKGLIRIIVLGFIIGITVKVLHEKQINVTVLAAQLLEKLKAEVEKLDVSVESPTESGSDTRYRYAHPPAYSGTARQNSASRSKEIQIEKEDARLSKSSSRGKTDLTGTNVNAKEYPVPHVIGHRKARFCELDAYAANLPAEYEVSMKQLVAKLTEPAGDEVEKARLIYSWIATHVRYDDRGFNTGFYCDTEAESVFRYKVAVCEGYSNLFTAMGTAAGLEVESVSGYSKGISHKPGRKFTDTNHAWNAFRADGKWRLADVTWGAGFGKAVNGKLVSEVEYNDFWFDTDPDRFIFTHFPGDSRFQFTSQPVTMAEYERMPKISAGYFSIGFDGSVCLQQVKEGRMLVLPEVFNVDGSVIAVSLPMEREVRAGEPLSIRLRSSEAVKMALINNGEWVYMQKNGDEFLAVINPRPGDLSLQVKFDQEESFYNTMLKYKVR